MEGKWLSILEYATYKKKSISTIRRSIKAKRVKYKEEKGKYFVWAKEYSVSYTDEEKNLLDLKLELERVKKENMLLNEELNEKKMLINLYENGHGPIMASKVLEESVKL